MSIELTLMGGAAVAGVVSIAALVAPFLAQQRGRSDDALSARELEHIGVTVDIWLPIALVLPLVAQALSVDGTVRGIGWAPVAGPIAAGLIVGGVAMIVRRGGAAGGAASAAPEVGRSMPWAAAGAVLLLLGAAHALTLMVGQCLFAIGAVLLWIQTPPAAPRADRRAPTGPVERRAGWGLLIVLLFSVSVGMFGVRAAGEHARSVLAITVLFAIAGGIPVAYAAGVGRGLRIAGGIATVGVFFGLGMLTIARLLPEASRMIDGFRPPPMTFRVAWGFGTYSIEATLLIAFAVTGATLSRMSPPARRAVGIALVGAGIGAVVRGIG